jgi:transcriptional regulator with XRE-family HTH domain
MLMSPLRLLRLSLSLSQKRLALACGTSTQTVLRAEQGLFTNPPAKVVRFLAESIAELSESTIRGDYYLFQTQKRLESRDWVRETIPPYPGTVAELLRQLEMSYYDFCVSFCLDPSYVHKALKGGPAGEIALAFEDLMLGEEWNRKLKMHIGAGGERKEAFPEKL